VANFAYQVTGFAYQGDGAFAYQGASDGVVPSVVTPSGRWQPLRKRTIRIKRSEYASLEEYHAAVAAAMQEARVSQIVDAPVVVVGDDADDDDEILLIALTRYLH
jgi:hypothetical protein